MYYVYVLVSRLDGRLYKGITNDVSRRVGEHNAGRNKSTKAYKPWEIVLVEEYNTRIEAREREKFYKSGTGRDKLKQIIRTRSSTE